MAGIGAMIPMARKEKKIDLDQILELIPAIAYTDLPGKGRSVIYMSPKLEATLGFAQGEFRRDPDLWQRRLHPGDRDRVLAEMDTGRPENPCIIEYRLLSREDRPVWFRDESIPASDPSGKGVRIQGVMFDITEFKETAEALAE